MIEIDEGEYLELLAAKDALTGLCNDLITLEDKEWKPMQCFRSDAKVAHDEARHELACEIAEQARVTLAQVKHNDEAVRLAD